MSDATSASAATPGSGHNKPPQSETKKLFGKARKALRASSRHTKEAREQLHAFLVHVMEICEYARRHANNASAVRDELDEAGVLHLKREKDDWFAPLVNAAFDKKDREAEKTNISKYVSVLKHAERLAKSANTAASELLKQLFADGASVARLASDEAKARRADAAQKAGAAQKEGSKGSVAEPASSTPAAASKASAAQIEALAPTLEDLTALWDRADGKTQTLFRQSIGCVGDFAVTAA
jgi:hypothetical protein